MNSNKLLLFLIILFGCLGQFASDIYTPSVPAIAQQMRVAIDWVQWTMAAYMLGLALSLLVYGPLSERMGRKKPLLIGLVIFIVGSAICIAASNIQLLLVGRFIQGIGAGACTCMWRSVFRDVYSGEQLAKYSSYLTMAVVFVIPAAPLVGGYLQHYFNWQASFVFILAYGLITLLLVLIGLRETHHQQNRINHTFHSSLRAYWQLLKTRVFILTTVIVLICYGAFFAWFIVSPALLIHQLHISPVAYGWINFTIGAVTYVVGGRTNAALVSKFGIPVMLRIGWLLMFVAGIGLLLAQFIFGLTLLGVVLPAVIFYFGTTFIWPNTFATAFTPIGKVAGFASAIYSFMQILGGALLGGVLSHIPDNNAYPLALSFTVVPVLAWLVFEVGVKPRLKMS